MTAAGDNLQFSMLARRPARPFQTVGDMVLSVLRESILTGAFAPGEYLRQDRIAEALGVSRIPVRSALLQLEIEGLITFYPFKGAVVTSLTAAEMREIYEIRTSLESLALRKAAPKLTPERLDRLESLAAALNEIADGESFLETRSEFYRQLFDVTSQPYLVRLIEKLRLEAGRYWLMRHGAYVQAPGERDHLKLLALLREGDVEGAVAWHQAHLDRVSRELIAQMRADEQEHREA